MVNAFIIGRPGSGKSTVAQLLEMLVRDNDWFTYYINDYDLLHDMFSQEESQPSSLHQRQFQATGPKELNAFDVVDFTVLNTVLKKMEEKVIEVAANHSVKKTLFILEFARDNYSHALSLFSSEFLQNSCIIYLDANLEICIERINQRIPHGNFVSENIMRNYYCKDDWPTFKQDFNFPGKIFEPTYEALLSDRNNEVEQIFIKLQTEAVEAAKEQKTETVEEQRLVGV
jgi:adenylate kinase family enzyme